MNVAARAERSWWGEEGEEARRSRSSMCGLEVRVGKEEEPMPGSSHERPSGDGTLVVDESRVEGGFVRHGDFHESRAPLAVVPWESRSPPRRRGITRHGNFHDGRDCVREGN